MPTTHQRPGTPSPDRWIVHESIINDNKAIENVAALFAGQTCTNAVPLASLVTVAGASRARVRFRATCNGTLELLFCRPGASKMAEVYAAGNPASVAVTANTETLLTTTEVAGEALALIRFTPSAAGAVNFCDFMAL